jgi:nucleotide-binding universal stress UspA family protein
VPVRLHAMPGPEQPLLLCYDDSDESEHALREAARLFPDARVVVLHVWRPLEATAAYRYSAAGLTGALADELRELDAAGQETAQQIAERGAELAREVGLIATARAEQLVEHEAPTLVTAVAAEIDARLVVLGSRRLGPVRAAALGGFSHGVLHESERPVLVVPAAVSP